jgi:hypothetical protein
MTLSEKIINDLKLFLNIEVPEYCIKCVYSKLKKDHGSDDIPWCEYKGHPIIKCKFFRSE